MNASPLAARTIVMTDQRKIIVDAAETMIRGGGYNGFSLEEVAEDLNMSMEDIQVHFPLKGDLALAVAIRYTFNFLTALGDPTPADKSPEDQLRHYCNVFHKAFEDSGQACLCGVLSKDAEAMPAKVRNAVVDFVGANIDWLTRALAGGQSDQSFEDYKDSAQWIYCSLQGAMTAAALTGDKSWIESASKAALERLFEKSTG